MRRVNFLVKLAACFALLTFGSCDTTEQEVLWDGFGTITEVADSQSMTLLDDEGKTINLSGSSAVLSSEYVNKRASVLFTRTDENPQKDDKVQNGKLEFFFVIPTYDITSISGAVSDKEMFETYGSRRVTPIEAWIGGGYLNLSYQFYYSDATSVRKVSAVVNYARSEENKIIIELFYKEGTFNDEEDYEDLYNVGELMSCYKLNDINDINDDTEFVLEFEDIETSESSTLTIKGDGEVVQY